MQRRIIGDHTGPFANKRSVARFAPTAFGQNPKRTCVRLAQSVRNDSLQTSATIVRRSASACRSGRSASSCEAATNCWRHTGPFANKFAPFGQNPKRTCVRLAQSVRNDSLQTSATIVRRSASACRSGRSASSCDAERRDMRSDADLQRSEYPLFLKWPGSTRSDQTEGTRTGIKFAYATQITMESCITLHCSGIEPICRIN